MENKSGATKGIIIVVVTLLIMLVVFLITNSVNKGLLNEENKTMNAQLGEVLIKNIETSEVHYIDKSLVNVPLSVPYKVLPKDATNRDIDIVSSDSSIVRVNDDNTITALQVGEVTLTLIANDGSNVTASLKIVIE